MTLTPPKELAEAVEPAITITISRGRLAVLEAEAKRRGVDVEDVIATALGQWHWIDEADPGRWERELSVTRHTARAGLPTVRKAE